MWSSGALVYADLQRWLLDNGTVLTEIEWCPSLLRWWRVSRHTGRRRAIILGCVARAQAEGVGSLTPSTALSPGVGGALAGEGPPPAPAPVSTIPRGRRRQEQRIAWL